MFLYCSRCDIEIIPLKGKKVAACYHCKGPLVQSTPDKIPNAIQMTTDIPREINYKIPETIHELFDTRGSLMGHSAVSSYLSCPERSRLNALGVHRKGPAADAMYNGPKILNELEYGTLIHAALGIRKAHGWSVAHAWLAALPIAEENKQDAFHLCKTYDFNFPMPESDQYGPITTVGLETEVFTEIGNGAGGSLLRTVRYDELITRFSPDGSTRLYSLEHKTTARGGQGVADSYMPQLMTQVALWNLNPHLVAKYGPMEGVYVDALIKTKVPKAERWGPYYINPIQIQRIVEYLRLPEAVRYPVNADGSYARMLQTCWGRWRPCQYIGICHYGEYNNYTMPQIPAAIGDDMAASGD